MAPHNTGHWLAHIWWPLCVAPTVGTVSAFRLSLLLHVTNLITLQPPLCPSLLPAHTLLTLWHTLLSHPPSLPLTPSHHSLHHPLILACTLYSLFLHTVALPHTLPSLSITPIHTLVPTHWGYSKSAADHPASTWVFSLPVPAVAYKRQGTGHRASCQLIWKGTLSRRGREEWWEGGRNGGRDGWREGGRNGGREEWREGWREGGKNVGREE